MNMDNDNTIVEYEMLRAEINQKIELVNSLTTFTLTTVVAILTFALTKKNSLLYLLPFCIIIPMYKRISYYRSALVKISAYMIVFLEKSDGNIKWETRNVHLMKNIKRKDGKMILKAEYYEGLVVSVICYILYAYNYVKGKELNIALIFCTVIPVFLVIWMWFIIKHINDIDGEKQEWIKEWEKVKLNKSLAN